MFNLQHWPDHAAVVNEKSRSIRRATQRAPVAPRLPRLTSRAAAPVSSPPPMDLSEDAESMNLAVDRLRHGQDAAELPELWRLATERPSADDRYRVQVQKTRFRGATLPEQSGCSL